MSVHVLFYEPGSGPVPPLSDSTPLRRKHFRSCAAKADRDASIAARESDSHAMPARACRCRSWTKWSSIDQAQDYAKPLEARRTGRDAATIEVTGSTGRPTRVAMPYGGLIYNSDSLRAAQAAYRAMRRDAAIRSLLGRAENGIHLSYFADDGRRLWLGR
ncbi:hypothetical protein OAX78_00290 [Planctomycetota bacterium]|nr:hypothetical protein [Planctomycetota bacterium]